MQHPQTRHHPKMQSVIGRVSPFDGAAMHYPNLRFSKTGIAIRASISQKTAELNKHADSLKMDLDKICKERELNVDELVESVQIGQSENYTNTQLANVRVKAALQELADDINNAVQLVNLINYTKSEVKNLTRVYSNLDDNQSFSLEFQELTDLGF